MESGWVEVQSVTVVEVGTYPSSTQYGLWLPQPSGWGSGPRLDWLSPSFHQWTGGRGRGGGSGHWVRQSAAGSRGCVLTATFLIWSPANHLSISSTAVNACVLYSVRGRERHMHRPHKVSMLSTRPHSRWARAPGSWSTSSCILRPTSLSGQAAPTRSPASVTSSAVSSGTREGLMNTRYSSPRTAISTAEREEQGGDIEGGIKHVFRSADHSLLNP